MNPDYIYPRDAARQNVPGFIYEEISPAETSLRAPPRILVGPVPRLFGRWHWGDRQAPAVGLHTIDDVTLRADRVLTRDDRFVCVEQNGIHPQSIQAALPLASDEPLNTVDEPVVLLCGPAYQMYGHWLVDFLPRLYVLVHLGMPLDSMRYLLPANTMPFARRWLSLLGIPDDCIRPYDTGVGRYHLRRALIPTGFRGDGRANPLLADAMRDYKRRILGEGVPEAGERRLFISRRRWSNDSRTLTNGAEIEALFAAEGFEIVYPEEMDIVDQVRLFSESRVLAGEYGSGLHNSIFAGPGATVIAFRGTEGHPGFLQSGLCAALRQDAGYVFCETRVVDGRQSLTAADDDVELLRVLLPSL